MQSKDRCKMQIGIYIKQISNCLDNLPLAKQVSQFMKTLSKINSEKESHFSQSKPRRPYNTSEMVLCPILCGINLSHIYAREVRWNFEFDSWYSSKICSCLSKKNWHSLHLLFLIMSTLKGDVQVNIFHFTNFFSDRMWKKVNIV